MSEHNQQGTGKHSHKSSEENRGRQQSPREAGNRTAEEQRASSEHGSSHEHGDRRESKEENHRHQEEGAQKRIDELGQQHHQKK